MIEGGMRMPSVPPAHTTPEASRTSWPAQHRREGQQTHQRHRGADDPGRGREQSAGVLDTQREATGLEVPAFRPGTFPYQLKNGGKTHSLLAVSNLHSPAVRINRAAEKTPPLYFEGVSARPNVLAFEVEGTYTCLRNVSVLLGKSHIGRGTRHAIHRGLHIYHFITARKNGSRVFDTYTVCGD